jgi:ribosomal protein S18 acetylase RimI-like enzyme
VDIHVATLPARLCDLTPLGVAVVRRFYLNLLRRDLGFVLVSTEGDRVVGFGLIAPDVGRCMHDALVGSPSDVVFLLARARPSALLHALVGGTGVVPHVPEYIYLGVDLSCRSRGHGRALFVAGEAEMRRRGFRTLQLKVMADNTGAIRLYEACGYRVSERYRRHGAPMLTMSKEW